MRFPKTMKLGTAYAVLTAASIVVGLVFKNEKQNFDAFKACERAINSYDDEHAYQSKYMMCFTTSSIRKKRVLAYHKFRQQEYYDKLLFLSLFIKN